MGGNLRKLGKKNPSIYSIYSDSTHHTIREFLNKKQIHTLWCGTRNLFRVGNFKVFVLFTMYIGKK